MKFSALTACLSFLFKSQLPKTAITQVGFFGYYMTNKLPQVLDIGWCFQHFFTGFAVATRNFTDFTPLSHAKTLTFLGFLAVWAIRLGGYVYYARVLTHPEKDPRYEDTMADMKYKNLFMFSQFQTQGVMTLFTAIPLYFLFNQNPESFSFNNYLGLGMAIVGLTGQTISDQQLFKFKQSVNWEKTQTLREGFWKKARHPNLFFDLMTWTGLAVAALDMNNLSGTIWAFLGPAALFAAMQTITTPMTTKEMKRTKVGYAKIMAETNKYIPF